MQPLVSHNLKAKILLNLLSVSVRYALFLTIFILAICFSSNIEAGTSVSLSNFGILSNDSTVNDTIYYNLQELQNDTVISDSVTSVSDSVVVKRKPSPLKDNVKYSAKDSMRVEVDVQKLHLFGEAKVNYQNIELTASYIILDLASEEVFAKGLPDSLGVLQGRPDFKQGSKSFQSDSMRYNFTTKSGIIYHIITQEGEGYLHSDKTKRHANEHIHLEDGKYTTCSAAHPHFYMALTKGIVIPEDKIITGPAYMVFEDIPIKFLGLPFAFFPNTTERASGILMPTYGEERGRGFFLRDLGWYQTLSDYADLTIRGDIYENETWALRNTLRYSWRYHFSGNLGFSYGHNYNKYEPRVPATKSYKVLWSHRQDPKSNPTQTFSANVNFTSLDYDRNYTYTPQYMNASTSSSIGFSKRWINFPFNLTLSANADQNKISEEVDLNLPSGTFRLNNSIQPFRKKSGSGKYKWYENISFNYTSQFYNKLSTYNEVLFVSETWDSLKNGFQHDIPLSVAFKIGKPISITPSLNYRGVLFTRHIEMSPIAQYDSLRGQYVEEVKEFKELRYEHAINPSIGASITPKFYGMFVSKKGNSYISAVRHVLSPSVSSSFTPDMSKINRVHYYDTVYKIVENDTLVHKTYNWYQEELYSPPSGSRESGSVRIALNNNFEMKVRPKNDTTGQQKKITLLDNLNFSTVYNPFADSMNWSNVNMITGTSLFNNALNIRLSGLFSPYSRDSLGRDINQFYFKAGRGYPLRFVSMSINTTYSLRSGQGRNEEKETAIREAVDEYIDYEYYPEDGVPLSMLTGDYIDFDIPWSIRINHSFSISKQRPGEPVINHNMDISGDISFTKKWKIQAQMHTDLHTRKIVNIGLNIHRDLHCWELSISAQPLGSRKYYSFTIRAKASLLRDLKYEKKPNYYDVF